MFFEWFYPDYMQVMLKGLQSWGADLLSTSLLKFYSEFVNNRSQRLTFERWSADGILLFRETSKVLITYGNVSGERYACIAVCPSMLNCFL
jgi:exportin-7